MFDTGISVLVLYENFAVGAAVLRRLLDLPMVHMVRAEAASACEGSYDVVVLCPYLREHRRTEILRRWAGAAHGTAVVELEDVCGSSRVRLVAGRPDSLAALTVLDALRPIAAAAV
jgi:hypothetical protein